MVDLLADETILAAIIGAVVGSVVSYFLVVTTNRRKQVRDARQGIIAELAHLGYDYSATLQELQAAKESNETGAVRSHQAQLTRLDGSLVAIQTRLWNVFPQRRVRAALARFLDRCVTVSEYLSDKVRGAKDADVALSWLSTGLEELIKQSAVAARLPLRDPARAVWVGFRVVTPEDKRLLSFVDEPAPWKFTVSFDFTRKADPAVLEKIRFNMESRAENLRCKTHNRAAHVLLHGKSINNFDIQMDTCCSEFGKTVVKALGVEPKNSLNSQKN